MSVEVRLPDKISFLEKYALKKYVLKPNRIVVEVKPEVIYDLFSTMVKDLESGKLQFYVSTIVGTDLIKEGKIQLDYHIILLPEGIDIVVRTYLPRDSPRIKSIIDILPGALAGECETYDLLGIVFDGNIYLKRGFFVPPDVYGKNVFPLRKDSGV